MFRASLAALFAAALIAAAPHARMRADAIPQVNASKEFQFQVRDVQYHFVNGKPRFARLYQPAGKGPFPAVVYIHGGGWMGEDRTDAPNTALDLAEAGILTLALDFRNSGEEPYPASLQDINYGIRWLKTHSREFGSTPDRVGIYGTSSGGHQAVLSAIRPEDPRYRALPLAEAPQMDAKVAFVVSGWGVLYPNERYKVAESQKNADIMNRTVTFFRNVETQLEATPALIIERGEKVYLPPAMIFQGTADRWTTVQLFQHFADVYRKAGGTIQVELFEGEPHTFVNNTPYSANSVKAVNRMKEFIKKYAGETVGTAGTTAGR